MPAHMAYLLARRRCASANPGRRAAGQRRSASAVYAGRAGIVPPGSIIRREHRHEGKAHPHVKADPGHRQPPLVMFSGTRTATQSDGSTWGLEGLEPSGVRESPRSACVLRSPHDRGVQQHTPPYDDMYRLDWLGLALFTSSCHPSLWLVGIVIHTATASTVCAFPVTIRAGAQCGSTLRHARACKPPYMTAIVS